MYGDGRGAYRVLVVKPEGKRPPRRPRCRCRILRWIFNKCDVGAWTGFGLGQQQVVGFCECHNELSDCIKCGEFIGYLRNCWLLKKYSVPWSF
jgi:hypothetical protein